MLGGYERPMGTNLTNSLNSGAPLLSSTGQIFLSMPILISGTPDHWTKGVAMNFPFFNRGAQSRHQRGTTSLMALWPTSAHVIESDYAKGLCRFTLDCSCGVHFDTPYIDEALEWRELHEGLAPLADQLPA